MDGVFGTDSGSYYMRLIKDAAESIAVKMIATPVQDASEIERAIDAFTREPNGSLLVLPDVTTAVHRELIVALAVRHRLPAVYSNRYYDNLNRLVLVGLGTQKCEVRERCTRRKSVGSTPSRASRTEVGFLRSQYC